MNIAPSTDPTPMPAHGDSNVAFAKDARDRDTTPFADLLGASHEHLPDGASPPKDAEPRRQKQPEDACDPDLAILLGSMLPQVSLNVPLSARGPDGSAVEMNEGKSGVTSSVAGVAQNAVSPDFAGTNALFNESASVAGVPVQSGSIASVKMQSDGVQSASSKSRGADSVPDSTGVSAVTSADAKVAASATPSSESLPLPSGLPNVGAAAEISSPAEQAIATPIPVPLGSELATGILRRQSHDISSAAIAGESGGTTAAMQQVMMKEQSPERQMRTAANIAVTSTFQGKQRVADIPEKSSGAHVSESTPTIPTTAGLTFEPQAGRGAVSEAPVVTAPTAASEITRQTFDLIERVRVTGRDNAEVRMLLNDGQQVTVSIRLERGEWKPVFKTESEALCRALEQNWNRAVAQPAPQSVKFGAPVFESRSAQSDLGSSSQQQSESGGRERSFNRREQDSIFENVVPFRATGKATRNAHASPFSEAAAMQVYA